MSRYVPRSLMIAAATALFAVAVANCQARALDPAMSFETVLDIAGSDAPDAKERLEKIAAAQHGTAEGVLANAVLARWNDAARTYASDYAIFLPYKPDFPPAPVFAIAQVDVNVSGRATGVRIVKIDHPEHQTAVEEFLKSRRYLPARKDGHYVPSTAGVTVKPEVR